MKKHVLVLLSLFLLLSGCKSGVRLSDSVSERRTYLYLGEANGYTVKASVTEREYPYALDGEVGDLSPLFEVTITAPERLRSPALSFSSGGKPYGGELSFDSVKEDYSFSCALVPTESQLLFRVGDAEIPAARVNEEDRSERVLASVAEAESEFFASLTEGNRFAGEIRIRLLYDDACFYYIGVTDAAGKTTSFLTDFDGTILAKREH